MSGKVDPAGTGSDDDAIPTLHPATPAEVAAAILRERFPDGDADAKVDAVEGTPDPGAGAAAHRDTRGPTGRAFPLADFQHDAVRRARTILQRRGGVIIADSVGLGKTYIALALAEEALRAGESVLLTVPAALRRTWRPGVKKLDAPRRPAREDDGPKRAPTTPILLLSHTALARLDDPGRFRHVRLVIADEAHAFRNRRTRRYRALARITAHARVVLLTATPVNNGLADLYALLRLFAHDAAFADLGIHDLRSAFRDAERGEPIDEHDGYPAGSTAGHGATARSPGRAAGAAARGPAPDIRAVLPVLREVMVRRTRPFIREHYGAVRLPGENGESGPVLRFPRRAPPRPVRYAVAPDGTFDVMADELMALDFAALGAASPGRRDRGYRPRGSGAAERRGRGADEPAGVSGIAELTRLGLLKRLESGLPAFLASIRRQLRFHDAFLDALRAGRILRPRTLRAASDGDQLTILPLVGKPVPRGTDVRALAGQVRRDRDRLRRLETLAAASRAAASSTTAHLARDPKLAALLQVLDELDGHKVVVFTEFRDTAEHLWRALLPRGHVGRVDGSGAWLGTGRAGRRTVVEHFAPAANGAAPPPPHARVDTLIATDVLAEGLNLQDAAHVVSYDLPWNPVRLIQRVGRVDRLGSPHDTVYPLFFLPGDELEQLLGLVRRVRRKLATIGAAVGAEGAVLDGESRVAGAERGGSVIDALARGDADVLDTLERADAAPFEAEERLRVAWEKWKRTVEPIAKPSPHPVAATFADPDANGPVTLVAACTAYGPSWTLVDDDGRCRDEPVEACRILEAALAADHRTKRHGTPWSASASAAGQDGTTTGAHSQPPHRPHAAATRSALVHLSSRDAGPWSPAPVQARATRRLLRALSAERDTLAPETLRRADVVLERLAVPLSAAGESRLETAIRELEGRTGAAGAILLVGTLERALAGLAATAATTESHGGETPETPHPIGVLRVVPRGPFHPDPPR